MADWPRTPGAWAGAWGSLRHPPARWSLLGASSAPLRPKVGGTCVRLTQVATRGIEAGERLTRDFAQVPRVEARPPLGAPCRRLPCYLPCVPTSYLSTKQPAEVVPMLGFTGLFFVCQALHARVVRRWPRLMRTWQRCYCYSSRGCGSRQADVCLLTRTPLRLSATQQGPPHERSLARA